MADVSQQLHDIEEPSKNDVIFGQGAHCNYHEGSKQWRQMVKNGLTEYFQAERDKKRGLSFSVVKQVRANGGRFLVKNKTGKWDDIGDKEARSKTAQRFRDQNRVRMQTPTKVRSNEMQQLLQIHGAQIRKVSFHRGDFKQLAQPGIIEHQIRSYQVAQVERIRNSYDDFEPLPAFVPSDDRLSDFEPLPTFSQHGKGEQVARVIGDDDNDCPSNFEPLPAFWQFQDGDLAARGNRDDDDDRPSDFEPLPVFLPYHIREHVNQQPHRLSFLFPGSSSRTPSSPANFRTWSNNGTSSQIPHQGHSSTKVRPAALKGGTSNQHEHRSKRPSLNRDNSATSIRLKKQYIPSVFHQAQIVAGKHFKSGNKHVVESHRRPTVDEITEATQMLQKSQHFAGNESFNSLDYHHLYSSGPSIVTPDHSMSRDEFLNLFPVSNGTGVPSSVQIHAELQTL
uniref:DUF6824 domain-containing protein n=1 Tax=Pseudo-nitzschia australis TaxID=44445 RepID=A0A7S4AR67_9STRA|mmetsp:Transcript_27511/g.57741  ORF Transcript_27511/g.57741 Transcript_27511/m.57741 type:complete len:451 (+) Transcript_27511:132-1484(+)